MPVNELGLIASELELAWLIFAFSAKGTATVSTAQSTAMDFFMLVSLIC
jgi:hypothetical protein